MENMARKLGIQHEYQEKTMDNLPLRNKANIRLAYWNADTVKNRKYELIGFIKHRKK